jgi:hypothetical protein
MKKLIAILMLCFISYEAFPQVIEVIEVKEKIKGQVQPCLSFTSTEGSKDLFDKEWKKLMKQYKGKAGKGDEIVYINPNILGLNNDTLVVYAIIRTTNTGIEFTAAFETRTGFVSKSTHPSQYEVARSFLYNFALESAKLAIRETLATQQKELAKQERDLENMKSTKAKLEGDILKYEKLIEQARADIDKNLKDQEVKTVDIQKQKDLIMNTEKRLREIR